MKIQTVFALCWWWGFALAWVSDAFVIPPCRRAKHPTTGCQTALYGRPLDEEAWNRNIANLRTYYNEHGDSNVPYGSKKHPKLGRFLRDCRGRQGRLTEARRAELDAMGFIWKDVAVTKGGQSWEGAFQRLVAYKKVHGHTLVPDKWKGDGTPLLGRWVMKQRSQYKKDLLSDERIAKLNSIGFVWRLRTRGSNETLREKIQWLKRFGELIQFYEENENLNAPRKGQTKQLGAWVATQRTASLQKKILQYRVDLLDDIQFPWTNQPQLDAKWLEQFYKYKEATTQEITVYSGSRMWADLQRALNEKDDLDPERKAMLDGIGFDWNPRNSYKPGVVSTADKRWHQRYQELIGFHKENGHFRVPPHQKQLYSWVSNQRRYNRNLSKERVQLLDTIGFPWSAKAALEQEIRAASAALAAIKG